MVYSQREGYDVCTTQKCTLQNFTSGDPILEAIIQHITGGGIQDYWLGQMCGKQNSQAEAIYYYMAAITYKYHMWIRQ